MLSEKISSKYVCDAHGTQINRNWYSSADCSGNPVNTINDVCNSKSYNNCTAICDKSDCIPISTTVYNSNDCSGSISRKMNYVPNICIFYSRTLTSQKIICSGGQIQFNIYDGSYDCSNELMSSGIHDSLSCLAIGRRTSIKFEGCQSSTISTTTSSPNSITSTTYYP